MEKHHVHHSSRPDKNIQIIFSLLAIASVIFFAIWWFNPLHIPHNFTGFGRIIDVILFILVSYVIWHTILMDVLTWSIALHIKPLRKQKPIPNCRVAFITTIVPQKESVDLLHACLPAMVRASYPHDTWLLDEGNDPQVKTICDQYGVQHFSRAGIDAYNTPDGKFTKTKGGNHNAWYDVYGNTYDFVAQIDTDFVPKADFLTKTLGYFRNPKVAFVGTPQIYGNTSQSFIAKGANEQQNTFYGAVMRGLSSLGMTFLIGANHVIRVKAFKEANFYTAHITEDLVTGMKLHAKGFRSVYVPTVLAIGQGPSTWDAYFTQQMRWAYGCIDILFHHSPKHFIKMKFHQALYYFFLQQHYFSGLAMALSVGLLSLYFIFGIRAASVDLFKFFLFYSGILLICWLMSVWLQRYSVGKEHESKFLLDGKIISIAAWPIWFLSFIGVLLRRKLSYAVTPKSTQQENDTSSPMVFAPHIFLGFVATSGLVSSVFTHKQSTVMLFWAFFSAILMLTIPFSQPAAIALSQTLRKMKHFLRYQMGQITHLPLAQAFENNRPTTMEILRDCIFLLSIVTLSFIFYVGKIGFYSDDWSFIGNFTLSKSQTLVGLIQQATTPNTYMRPMQNVYDALLFYLFGINPLGYQIINNVVFCAIIVLLYLILRKIRLPLIMCITIPLVFALLPNYSTDRFWYAAFQVNLSLLFFLLSLYAGLKACLQEKGNILFWKITSISCFIMSALSYEIILPLLLVNIFLFWNPFKRFFPIKKQATSNHILFIALSIIALFYVIIFKIKTTIRLGKLNYPTDAFHLFISIIHTNFWTLGLQVPFTVGNLIASTITMADIIATLLVSLMIFLYLFFVVFKKDTDLPQKKFMLVFTFLGLILFILGYAIFLTNNQVGFSPTGIDNRVAIVATIGIACVIVGIVGFLSRLFLHGQYAQAVFCMTIAIVCAGGFLVINSLASFWISAYQQSSQVIHDIHANLPQIPPNTTLLLDGVCPYQGPAIVFESQWDLKGALQMVYHDPTVKADIVTPRLKVTKHSIFTQIYTFKTQYPYKNLFIFNDADKTLYPIANESAAYAYFASYNPTLDDNCPNGSAGNGVSVL